MMRFLLFVGIFLACQFAHVVASLWMVLAAIGGRNRCRQIALGYDHLGNAVTGGQPGELISARANRARTEGRRWGCVLCKLLDKVDPGHCQQYD
jgi:hypothetical protein